MSKKFKSRKLKLSTSKPVVSNAVSTDVKEAMWTMAGEFDPDINLSATQGGSMFYRRLTKNPSRDLNPLTQARSIEIASWLFDTNPLSKRILELTRDYILGDGVEVRSHEDDDDKAQAVIDQFWDDHYNKMDLKLLEKVLELGLFGEQLYPVYVNPISGKVRLGYLDPAIISQVNIDPKDVSTVIDIQLGNALTEFSTMSTVPERFLVIHMQDDPNKQWFGRLVSVETDKNGLVIEPYVDFPDPMLRSNPDLTPNAVFPDNVDKTYLGGCFFFQINKLTNSRRGRSDLLSLADWVDGYDQILFGEIDRNQLMRNYIWDVTIDGATEKRIDDYIKKNSSPNPGSVRVHNEHIHWDTVQPNLNAADLTKDADLLLSYISTGSGHPKTWLNGLMDVNKSTASELGEPGYKRLKARQKYVRYMLETMINFVLDQAEIHGILDKRENLPGDIRPRPWHFVIHMPEIKSRDLAMNSNALLSTMQAIALALESQIIDVDVAQETFVMLLNQLGSTVDLKAMRDRIEANPVPVNITTLNPNEPSLTSQLRRNVKVSPSSKNITPAKAMD